MSQVYLTDLLLFSIIVNQFVNANLHYTRPDMRDSAKEKAAEQILQNSVMITGHVYSFVEHPYKHTDSVRRPMDLAEDGECI